MRKKWISSLCSCCLSLALVMNVMAAEETIEQSSDEKKDKTWLEDQLSQTYNNQYEFTLAAPPTDAVALNLKFINLQMEMENNGFGEDYTLAMPDSLDISQNAMDIFESNYGDIDFSIDEVSIPENFDVNSFLSQSKSQINDNYSNFINDEKFKKIYDNVSTSNLLTKIEDKINNPSDLQSLLVSQSTMSNLMAQHSTGFQNNANNQYNNILSNYSNLYQSKVLELDGNSSVLSTIENAKQNMADINSAIENGFNYPVIDTQSIEKMKKQSEKLFGKTMEEAVNEMFNIFDEDYSESSNLASEDLTEEEIQMYMAYDEDFMTTNSTLNFIGSDAQKELGIDVMYTINETSPYVTIVNENTTDDAKTLIFYRDLLRESNSDISVLQRYSSLSASEKTTKMATYIANNYPNGIALPDSLTDAQIGQWISLYKYCVDNKKSYCPDVSISENNLTNNLKYYSDWVQSEYFNSIS